MSVPYLTTKVCIVNPRSVFLFPTVHSHVYAVREAIIQALDHDVTFSSAVNTILAYGLVAIDDDAVDRQRVKEFLRDVDIFAEEPDPDRVLDHVQAALNNEAT